MRTVSAGVATEQSANEDFASPVSRGGSFEMARLAARHSRRAPISRRVVDAIVAAKKRDAGIVWGIGAHVIKTGVSPVLIDLMERGFVSALAMNGAGIIHDFEVALSGATSEDVDEALGPGRFGMAEETGRC